MTPIMKELEERASDPVCRLALAEIERLRAEVVSLAKLGDFSGLRPNSEVFQQVVRIKQSGGYELKAKTED